MLFEPRDSNSSFVDLVSGANGATASNTSPAFNASNTLGETAANMAASMSATTQSTATSAWSWFQSLSYVKYIIIILILAILGLNVFKILGHTTDTVTGIVGGPIRRIVAAFAWLTGETAKQVVTTTADGLEKTVNVAEDVAIGGIDVAEKALTGGHAIDRDLKKLSETVADESDEEGTMDGPKSGYCYIGTDRGVRSCARVGEVDKCMSGDIFPTEATCVNPKLRA
jgi:hypothetical protein